MSFRESSFFRTCRFIGHLLLLFLSRLLKSIWLFFPGVLFVVLAIWCFWTLGQGKDLMVAFTENHQAKVIFFIAIAFWVYVSWFSARIVAYQKKSKQEAYIKKLTEDLPANEVEERLKNPSFFELPVYYLETMPRIIGYACLLSIELAVLQSPALGTAAIASSRAFFIFLLGLIISWGLDDIVNRFADKQRKPARIIFYCLLAIFIIVTIIVALVPKGNLLMLLWTLLILHAVYLFYINLRRLQITEKILEAKNQDSPSWLTQRIFKVMDFLSVPRAEIGYFNWFNIVSLIGLIIYILTINKMQVAWQIGPLPFVLLAFAVLLGFGNILTALSVKISVNLHFIVFLVALCVGSKETHYIRTKAFDNTAKRGIFSKRQDIYTYFNNWVNARGSMLDTMTGTYPVYFVLANGGASRSGYWTASVLGKLEDVTAPAGDPFSRHVFCLSGTSGGGVGVATYFSLLYEHQKSPGIKNPSYLNAAKSFLGKDFLTYTLAHMLGPDYFKYIFHVNSHGMYDRVGALEENMEQGASECTDSLKASMGEFFSDMIALRNQPYNLPVLCINTTRMQDGNPGVVTNIQLDKNIFNNRIDVAGILNDSEDIRLSTAAIMGARFPYVSPAGRIDETLPVNRRVKMQDSMLIHYFVDGGYFDNSGAGVVQEMMRAILNYTAKSTDTLLKKRVAKLHFRVIHITNSPQGVAKLDEVSTLKNDLMAPALTIVGAYNMQTTVNDRRLVSFLEDINTRGVCKSADYYPIHLYKDSGEKEAERKRGDTLAEVPYAMNWFISDTTRIRMDMRLQSQPRLNSLIKVLKH
ncbi:MAG: hypothetical protein QM731_21280 [Chitinophagaceae bacterium]